MIRNFLILLAVAFTPGCSANRETQMEATKRPATQSGEAQLSELAAMETELARRGLTFHTATVSENTQVRLQALPEILKNENTEAVDAFLAVADRYYVLCGNVLRIHGLKIEAREKVQIAMKQSLIFRYGTQLVRNLAEPVRQKSWKLLEENGLRKLKGTAAWDIKYFGERATDNTLPKTLETATQLAGFLEKETAYFNPTHLARRVPMDNTLSLEKNLLLSLNKKPANTPDKQKLKQILVNHNIGYYREHLKAAEIELQNHGLKIVQGPAGLTTDGAFRKRHLQQMGQTENSIAYTTLKPLENALHNADALAQMLEMSTDANHQTELTHTRAKAAYLRGITLATLNKMRDQLDKSIMDRRTRF